MTKEKRGFTRVLFRMKAELSVDNILYNVEKITNISVNGCLLPIAYVFKEGTPCCVRIYLNMKEKEADINVEGEIIRSVPGETAVKFTSIDVDSFCYLRNIIFHNAEDSEKIESENLKHPGLI